MDVKANHTTQVENDSMWRIKQDTFFRISDQVGNIHLDKSIPMSMRNLSLYLEQSPGNSFLESRFEGIYRAVRYNMSIKEYVKYDDSNWVVFVDMYNIPDVEGGSVTDLNIENPYAEIDKIAVGCVDGQIMIAPGKSERVISISTNFESKKIKIDISRLKSFMAGKAPTNGYIVDQFNEGVYLVDSPSPLFGKDTTMYRDGDYVGMWISFGTLLKFDLRNLNVFNIDGVNVGAIDIDIQSPSIKTLKMLTNTAYGYASIIFSKKSLLEEIMRYSKRYVYETNMEDTTRICVDNLLETLQEKGIFGLLYEEFDVIEQFPLIAYDETTVETHESISTILRFKYKNEYIYMALDAANGKMYFVTYAGRISDYYSEKYDYNVKIMNDLWLTKANDVSVEGFVLFTGFPNLQHNKVLDIYFDNKTESFSSLDKNFAIDVHEFDATWNDAIVNGGQPSYNRNTDLIHAYGNNPFPLVSGLISYQYLKTEKEIDYFNLDTNAEPAITTIIDPEERKAYLMVPAIKTNAMYVQSISPIRVNDFLTNYMARWMEDQVSADKWVDEAEAGSYQYTMKLAYYSNGWTLYKSDDDTYSSAKLNPVKIEYIYSGAIEHLAMKKVEPLKTIVTSMRDEGMPKKDIEREVLDRIGDYSIEIIDQIRVQAKSMKSSFTQEIMTKNNQVSSIVPADSPKFKFDRFMGADNIFINNKPTGPVQNHAILFEDTFKNIYQKMQDEYFRDMDMEALPATVYCPYIRAMTISRVGETLQIEVGADMSTSIEMLKNDRVGVSFIGDMLEDNGQLKLGSTLMSSDEAYEKVLDVQYFGIKKLSGVFMNIFKLTTKKVMTDAAKEAYLEMFKTFNRTVENQTGYDYEASKEETHERSGISDSGAQIDPPDMPSSQPIYVANADGKLMVSLDGNSFVDAPIGAEGIYLTGRMFLNDKPRFLSMLRGMVNSDVNNVRYTLHSDDELVEKDIYSVGIKEIFIDHDDVVAKGYVDIILRMFVASGQIVLTENEDIIYSKGDQFVISKRVDVDGFISESEDRIRILVNANIEYYSQIPYTDHQFNSAFEMMSHQNTYKMNLGIPLSIALNRGDYVTVDRDEAEENLGLTSWFDFTE